MESKTAVVALAVLFAMIVVACGDSCPNILQFAPCAKFVQSPSAPSPSKGDPCCNLVTSLSQDCLCNAAKSNNPVVKIDFKKCLTLPKACGRHVPPNTYCNGVPVPT